MPVCNGEHTVWQFNFKGFKLSEDVYASDSIELLKQSGIDFAQVWGRVITVYGLFSSMECQQHGVTALSEAEQQWLKESSDG